MSTVSTISRQLTSVDILARKNTSRISAVTAYDFTFAKLIDGRVDAILVGDSLGMVIQGRSTTLPVTLDDVVYHTQCVSRAIQKSHLVADMPFMSYQANADQAVQNAGRLLAEGGAQAVKIEGGAEFAPLVKRLVHMGIPVMGHVGLTPQSVHRFGGFKVQGRDEKSREHILEDAIALEEAGAYSLVLEAIPSVLGAEITARLKIPTIGIGAGPNCDGQILVLQDLLGLTQDFRPRFVKRFAELSSQVISAIEKFEDEVQKGTFPSKENEF